MCFIRIKSKNYQKNVFFLYKFIVEINELQIILLNSKIIVMKTKNFFINITYLFLLFIILINSSTN